jgi:hypothetical protein
MASALESQSKALAWSRQFARTVTQLRELQKVRQMQQEKGENREIIPQPVIDFFIIPYPGSCALLREPHTV